MCFFPRRLWLCWMSRVSPRNMISFTCPSTSKIPAASATLSSTWFARALSWVGRPTLARISSKTNNTYQDMRITIVEYIEYQQVSLFRSYFSIGGMVQFPHSKYSRILFNSWFCVTLGPCTMEPWLAQTINACGAIINFKAMMMLWNSRRS